MLSCYTHISLYQRNMRVGTPEVPCLDGPPRKAVDRLPSSGLWSLPRTWGPPREAVNRFSTLLGPPRKAVDPLACSLPD